MYRYTDEMDRPDHMRSIVKAEDRPGLNLPYLTDAPELFFYDVTAEDDGTLTVVSHGDPARTTKGYAQVTTTPAETNGYFGYLRLSPGQSVTLSAPAGTRTQIQGETDLGTVTFNNSVVVIFHAALDADAVKARYES